MENTLESFPITGVACCLVLTKGSSPFELWTLKDIETISNGDASQLFALWRATRGKSIQITTKDLCDALTTATQVISLYIKSTENPKKELFIEDGELIERNLI